MEERRTAYAPDFGCLLFLVFLTLKLTDVIDWSWWWVTSPLWAGFALYFAIALSTYAVMTVVWRRRIKRNLRRR